ncbi:SLM1 family PH domain-containing protein [Aspergillus saccharolyticus JOP 1030-1]|uniref:PH domain protein n=1 Tax=Aspergillus saccharolyticus JOP 1030-1 TaxID=1450539 RepID=A0A319AJJ1_9EURO|nr:PH domain protein [Aspergillus saccharolyticus JOP 1030-1]PYH46812.1 PH domain protein [Aspergillus saccharolyticus JOP 1030-1]
MAMAVRSQTPVQDPYGTLLQHPDSLLNRGAYGARSSSRPNSIVASTSGYNNAPHAADPASLPHTGRFHEEFDAASQRGSVLVDGPSRPDMQRSASQMSQSRSATPTRSGTLRKKASLSRKSSMRRSGSKRSLRAGSVRSLILGDKEKYGVDGEDPNSAFYIPVPTDGSPTEVLANRFQSWRKILKDLIIFFKEVQKSYETRSKLFMSASNIMNNTSLPPTFLKSGGLADATEILRDFHRQGYMEATKAAEVESEVVNQLMGLRNDLQKKTKEIRGLSGDFRNSVDKEVDATRKAVRHLHEALGLVDTDPSATSGKGDPFIVRLSVDKQIEKQIEEENYLHRAFLNLENSGRELESIVVSEIQKAYNAYASILKREADETYDTVEKLRAGPISMPHDHEWNAFIADTEELVDPRVPIRDIENITYPGKDHPAAAEVRSGMLERKSKYLKSYTPGWYVLSPTHLHEFKSADRVAWQQPVMSLNLLDQKLGSHSQPDSTSHKFMLKGRQTGTMHRGHSWVFRAESHETMMAWYEDIESLMSKTGEARNAYVRRHVRTVSGASFRNSSDGMDEDEADRTPYSAESAVLYQERPTSQPRQPGGRFPSDVQIDRHLEAPLSPSSGESSGDRDLLAAAGSFSDPRPFGNTMTDGEVNGARLENQEYPRPVERHGSYYGTWVGAGGPDQQPQPMQQSYDRDYQDRDAGEAVFVTGMGSTSSRDPSLTRQRNRGASASTAPSATNGTEYTHNTVPTSIDEHEGPDVNVVGVELDGAAKQPMTNADLDEPALAVPSVGTAATDMAVPQNGSAKRPPAHTKSSVSALELQIPGHYPPANNVSP